jgi:hypothetical protein|tara:strand:+ start:245 stop:475 length:231 start_codon:yes stop_codon:yes gene_type:complete
MKINNKSLKQMNNKYYYITKCSKTGCIARYDVTDLVNRVRIKYNTIHINLIDKGIDSKLEKSFKKKELRQKQSGGG